MTGLKLACVLLMVAGEGSMIAAEVMATKTDWMTPRVLLFQWLAATLLLAAYSIGFKAWQDVWIVSVISVTTIVISEPIIVWHFTNSLPNRQTVVSLVLALSALVALTWGNK
jgi:hypothetical protein